MKLASGQGPFFAQVPFALLDDPNTDAETIAVYCALRRFTDFGSDKGCFASHTKLAKVAGTSRRTVIRRLEWLAEAGWIGWESGGKGKSNRYVVNNTCAPVAHPPVPEGHTPLCQAGTLPRNSNRETITERQKTRTPAAWVVSLAEDWTNVYGGTPAYGELGKRLKPLVDRDGFEPVQVRWRHYLDSTEGRYASPTRFAQTYGSWTEAGGAPAKEGDWIGPDDARAAFRAAGIPDTWAVNPDGYDTRAALNLAIAARLAKLTAEATA